MIDRAVVIAAGKAATSGDSHALALTQVGGKSLIRHVLEGLRSAGVFEVVVTGYRSAEIEDNVWGEEGLSIRFAR